MVACLILGYHTEEMTWKKKSTTEEARLMKKYYDRQRREKLKGCPETLGKHSEEERLEYLHKKKSARLFKNEINYILFWKRN